MSDTAGDTTRRQRHSIWHLTAETGRHRETSGRHDPEPASQHLASDRRDRETQGDKRETRPGASVTASGIQTQRETRTGRQEDKRKTGPRNRRHTFLFSIPQVRTPMLRCLGKKEEKRRQEKERKEKKKSRQNQKKQRNKRRQEKQRKETTSHEKRRW